MDQITTGSITWQPFPPAIVRAPDPLIALVAEMEEAFEAAKHHYTGGVITRPLNAMREVLVELARRHTAIR